MAVSQPCGGTWLYPKDSPNGRLTFNYNDEIIASWTSNCSAPEIIAWGPSSDEKRQILWNRTVLSPNGTYNYTFPASRYSQFTTWPFPAHFELDYNSTSDFNGIIGDVFNVTSTSGLPTTYALSTTYVAASSTGTATTTSAASSTSSTSTAPPTTGGSSSDSGLSTGAKVGIGVGVGVGVCLLLGVAICTFLVRRRRRQRQHQQHAESETGASKQAGQRSAEAQEEEQEKVHETEGTPVKAELPGARPAAELDTKRGGPHELAGDSMQRYELEAGDGRPLGDAYGREKS